MKAFWYKGMSAKNKKELKGQLIGSKHIFEILDKEISSKLNTSRKEQVNPASFDTPNWSEHQAYRAGYQQAMIEMLSLIEIKLDK